MLARWERFFSYYDIHPLRLTYERLEANPRAAADQVARWMDVSLARVPAAIEMPMMRHRDATSARWAARLRSEEG